MQAEAKTKPETKTAARSQSAWPETQTPAKLWQSQEEALEFGW